MRFDEEKQKHRIVDDNQHVSFSERRYYIDEWYELQRMNATGKLSKTQEIVTIVVSLCIIVFMIGMILYGTVFKDSDMFSKFMGFFLYEMFYVGAFALSLRNYRNKDRNFTVYDPARHIVSMIIFGTGVIMAIPLYLILYKESILFLGLPAIYFLSAALFAATERIRLYTRKTEAKCIGYARMIARNSRARGTRCYTTPVFEIDVNGEKTKVVYDSWIVSWNSDVELYSTVEVAQHRDDSTRIYRTQPFYILLWCGLAAAAMIIFLFGVIGPAFKLA